MQKKIWWEETTLGSVGVVDDGGIITEIILPGMKWKKDAYISKKSEIIEIAFVQIEEYLAGQRREFQLSVGTSGTAWQQRVWAAMRAIPYGETRTYAQVAAMAGKSGAARAVGSACNRNRLTLVIPCHRVVAAGGIGGFEADINIKQKLLDIEKKFR